MARRVFLHVGTPKSGTTYLQDLWWHHQARLAERGLLLPGSSRRDHFRAASLVCDRTEVVERLDAEGLATWDRLLDEAADWPRDVLITHELFSPASAAQADAALRRLEGVSDELHVVVTARDLVRQLPSDWQQNVKQGRSDTLGEFWSQVSADPDHGWWLFQDLPRLLQRWAQGVPPDRTHVVVLPPRGAQPPEWLWERTCRLLGVDPSGLEAAPEGANTSLGLAQVEVVRRVQAAVPAADRGLVMGRVTKGLLAEKALAGAGPVEPLVLPPDMHAWARDRGAAMAEELARSGYDVVGDLADLVGPEPVAGAGRTPEDVTGDEVADVAVQALTSLLVREARRREAAAEKPGPSRRRGPR